MSSHVGGASSTYMGQISQICLILLACCRCTSDGWCGQLRDRLSPLVDADRTICLTSRKLAYRSSLSSGGRRGHRGLRGRKSSSTVVSHPSPPPGSSPPPSPPSGPPGVDHQGIDSVEAIQQGQAVDLTNPSVNQPHESGHSYGQKAVSICA